MDCCDPGVCREMVGVEDVKIRDWCHHGIRVDSFGVVVWTQVVNTSDQLFKRAYLMPPSSCSAGPRGYDRNVTDDRQSTRRRLMGHSELSSLSLFKRQSIMKRATFRHLEIHVPFEVKLAIAWRVHSKKSLLDSPPISSASLVLLCTRPDKSINGLVCH